MKLARQKCLLPLNWKQTTKVSILWVNKQDTHQCQKKLTLAIIVFLVF